jgi:hypothetical protein
MNFGGFVNFLRNEELQVVHSALTKFHLPDSQVEAWTIVRMTGHSDLTVGQLGHSVN